MKKAMLIVLSLALAVGLVACSRNKAPTVTPSPSNSVAATPENSPQTGIGDAGNDTDNTMDGVNDDGTINNPADDGGLMGEIGDGVGDVTDGVGDAVGDAARGIGNAARNMTR